ncbi:hypothetical protein [Desulfotignum balticum]|jgi:hypothetical protein|uniref:hypothetical protein n=1 Tax=Desulfotignum balticum TaxID=115781 RepID=UPI00046281F6|nr:hypothetical protein [Desulfotignum balticum]
MLSAQFNAMRIKLARDVNYFESKCNESEHADIMRRAYVRAVFAFIEGYSYGFRQLSLKISNEHNGIELAPEEIIALREVEVKVEPSGEVREYPKYIPAKNCLAFSIAALAKQHEADYALDKSGQGWEDYLSALKIRDLLMHPKGHDDLQIANPEFEKAKGAYNWFVGELGKFEEALLEAKRRA